MAATQPLDPRILSQLIPREYNGKSAQEGRRFLAHTRLYLDQMDIAQIAPAISWIIALNRLTDHAARWTNPFIIQIAEGHTPVMTALPAPYCFPFLIVLCLSFSRAQPRSCARFPLLIP